MTYLMTLSPDFNTKFLPGWFVFNTWLQKKLNQHIHLEIYNDFRTQRDAITADKVDIIYANPYDASMLVRERGFVPVTKPIGRADEAIVATAADGPYRKLEDLRPGTRIASTDDPDVHTIGMILLEPADLNVENVLIERYDNYVVIVKKLLNGEADAGFFLAEMFNELSASTRSRLKVLMQSRIYVVHHALLVGPRFADHQEAMRDALTAMTEEPRTARILSDMGIKGWDVLDDEATEFMIDLMDTLV
ncbi:MAG: phosphate/phosphite/phosphonate ABC transporter substrate-binding protein [Gammaproteobacteria bacterium]|nr:phosphate/phosphite/phosphonate ABC transporter substrate-binding protein [Gammaproteobacteria bacterium]MBI5618637.1 phosphate/phosphite/phosphonate ABC transporter substrate-binding protein [Gammaproteobacteria bacterium]